LSNQLTVMARKTARNKNENFKSCRKHDDEFVAVKTELNYALQRIN